jgi:hypothetical protein
MTGSERFPYSPLPERPRLSWPDGARVALWVLPNIEHYEYRPPLINGRDPWPRAPHPDILNYGLRDYGNRVGVWRMFDCLDRHDIRSTISLNFGVIEHYPDIWEAMEARRCDTIRGTCGAFPRMKSGTSFATAWASCARPTGRNSTAGSDPRSREHFGPPISRPSMASDTSLTTTTTISPCRSEPRMEIW